MPWAESPGPLDTTSSELAPQQRPTLREFREARLGRPWANGLRGRRAFEAQVDAQAEAQAEAQVNTIFGLEVGGQPLAQREAELRDAEQRFWPTDVGRHARARFVSRDPARARRYRPFASSVTAWRQFADTQERVWRISATEDTTFGRLSAPRELQTTWAGQAGLSYLQALDLLPHGTTRDFCEARGSGEAP